MSSIDERQQEIERAAAEWVVRLDGTGIGQAEHAAFADWLEADPAHRAAFEHARKSWSDLDILKSQPGRLRSVIALAPKSADKPKMSHTRKVGVGLGLIFVGLLVALFEIGNPWIALKADYYTAAGEIRTVRLGDGTTVDLGASSAIAIEFDDNVRRVRLLKGEAFFAAAPKLGPERRPFVALAATGTTTALGTQFAVEDVGKSAVVTAVEHQIEVAVSGGRQGISHVVLSPGDTVQYDMEAGIGPVRRADVAVTAAWRRGLLVFDSVPLSDVVARLNRYRRGRIVVMNSALGERRVSGVFSTGNLDDVVETITAELGAHAISAPPLVTLLY